MTTKTNSPFKTTEYFTEAHHARYSEILNIPVSAFSKGVVGVSDVNDKNSFTLLLFHYHPDYVKRLDEPRFGYSTNEIMAIRAVRGIIIDVDSEEIVCITGPYTNSFIRSSVPDDGRFVFDKFMTDTFGVGEVTDCQYKEWIYGSLIRVFSHKGVTFMSTHKKISCANSHFGNSRMFSDIFFESQTVFPNVESIFGGSVSDGMIHLFILQDKDLIVDSRKYIDESRVYYICSFNLLDSSMDLTNQMKNRIESISAEVPIYFPRELTPAEANEILSPISVIDERIQSIEDIQDTLSRCGRDTALAFLEPGEKVFMTNSYGIFAVLPPSMAVRTTLMCGTANIDLAFSSCLSRPQKQSAVPDKLIVPYGFTYEQLNSMKDSLIQGMVIDFSEYEALKPTEHEIILTNLVFSCPLTKIQKCFDIYDSFGTKILETADFFWMIAYELKTAIQTKTFDEFIGITKGSVQLKRYIQNNFPACLYFKATGSQKCIDDIIGMGPMPHWHVGVVERFKKNVRDGRNSKDKEFMKKNAVLCFVMNAPGDIMSSLLRFEEKMTKAKIAEENRKKGFPPKVEDDA